MASVTVEVNDVVKRYLEGDLLSEFTEDQVQTQITDAVDWADSRWLTAINARLASGKLTPNLYKRTVSDAVLRVMRNPSGLASEGELGYNYVNRPAVASGNLWYTADDLATLAGVSTSQIPSTIGVRLDRGWR